MCVLQRVQQLCLVHMAAQSMGHTVVAQGAHCSVEGEGVRVEALQVQALRQLQDVHAPVMEVRSTGRDRVGRDVGDVTQTTERQRDARSKLLL